MMAAFADAVYRVYDGDSKIDLRIGQANPAMAALLARHGVAHGGLVTGENPFGQKQSDEANAAAFVAHHAGLQRSNRLRISLTRSFLLLLLAFVAEVLLDQLFGALLHCEHSGQGGC